MRNRQDSLPFQYLHLVGGRDWWIKKRAEKRDNKEKRKRKNKDIHKGMTKRGKREDNEFNKEDNLYPWIRTRDPIEEHELLHTFYCWATMLFNEIKHFSYM